MSFRVLFLPYAPGEIHEHADWTISEYASWNDIDEAVDACMGKQPLKVYIADGNDPRLERFLYRLQKEYEMSSDDYTVIVTPND